MPIENEDEIFKMCGTPTGEEAKGIRFLEPNEIVEMINGNEKLRKGFLEMQEKLYGGVPVPAYNLIIKGNTDDPVTRRVVEQNKKVIDYHHRKQKGFIQL